MSKPTPKYVVFDSEGDSYIVNSKAAAEKIIREDLRCGDADLLSDIECYEIARKMKLVDRGVSIE